MVFKMCDSVTSARYSSIFNVLRQWSILLIPTYRVYRLYDNNLLQYNIIQMSRWVLIWNSNSVRECMKTCQVSRIARDTKRIRVLGHALTQEILTRIDTCTAWYPGMRWSNETYLLDRYNTRVRVLKMPRPLAKLDTRS